MTEKMVFKILAVFTQFVKSSEEGEVLEYSDILCFHFYEHFP